MPRPVRDLSGQRFGKLTAIRMVARDGNAKAPLYALWLCRCDCGSDVIVKSKDLVGGQKKSCGCLNGNMAPRKNGVPGRAKDLTGRKFGRLTVVSYAGRSDDGRIMWLCKCSCGNTKTVMTQSLTSGDTRSCGCLLRNGNKKQNNKRQKMLSEIRKFSDDLIKSGVGNYEYTGGDMNDYDEYALAMTHLGNVLHMLAGLHSDDRTIAFESALEFYNNKTNGHKIARETADYCVRLKVVKHSSRSEYMRDYRRKSEGGGKVVPPPSD